MRLKIAANLTRQWFEDLSVLITELKHLKSPNKKELVKAKLDEIIETAMALRAGL